MSRNYATCASAHEALWRGHSYSLGSFPEIGALKPRPTIAPSFTTTAPTGTSRHFANAFAPAAPTATYIAGVKTTRAKSTRSGGVVGGDQVLPSSLNTTAPLCPTAMNREPNTTLFRF